ncbi:MAG: DUF4412 domain-containing protein [Proteobacteria bacterium]|nr:DUF4412 domain-containing protein [Pseudomonadota bacterium]MBU1389029.1 DUF4412 domain-containing protein [Pseudomonadota bacterium]MBU1543581.1 DUF4412 domain-containing protein [Pseudomonadota bacterium]MBU2481441.1 DUF4412 domain-containing protein [Pseudomonadota bacterium]
MKHIQIKKTSYLFLLPALILTVCLLMPGTSTALMDGKIDKFSADQVELSADGKALNTLKIYVTPDAFRMDGMPGTGMDPDMPKTNISMLTLMDKKEHYILNHDKKLYCVTPLDEDSMPAAMKDYKESEKIKKLGTETISGYTCTKKQVTTTATVMGMTTTSKMLIWESDRFDMPLRVQAEEDYTTEIRNIKKGAPPASLFKLPAGYTKVDNMMLVMGMDFGNMGASMEPDSDDGDTADDEDSSQDQEAETQELENAIKGLGDKLKNFKFGN